MRWIRENIWIIPIFILVCNIFVVLYGREHYPNNWHPDTVLGELFGVVHIRTGLHIFPVTNINYDNTFNNYNQRFI